MLDRPFHVQIGPYWLSLPEGTQISCDVKKPASGAYRIVHTHWVALIGRFRLGIHLDPINDLQELKRFIDYSTKSDVTTPQVCINGVDGVMHGSYASPATWIDWWFKKGDTMICLNLQGASFPFKENPTEAEVTQHEEIIGSLMYCRDTPLGPIRPPR
jgi:hypothetical protein